MIKAHQSEEQSAYAMWARTIVDRFFGKHMAGQRSRLIITKDLLDDDFAHLGGSRAFVRAVESGPCFPPGIFSIHEQALYLNSIWRKQPSNLLDPIFELPDDAPLFLPHLALLCVGWSVDEEGLDPHAFYERLNTIIPDHGLSSSKLKDWLSLWKGLEQWTQKLKGKRGIFEVEQLGGMKHVGIPRSQVILTPARIARLPELFVTTGLGKMWEAGRLNEGTIRNILLENEGKAIPALGSMLFTEIRDDSPIGKGTIARLTEYLGDPDFRSWTPARATTINKDTGDGEGQSSLQPLALRLVLTAIDSPPSWTCSFGLLEEEPPPEPENHQGWKFHRVSGDLLLASNEHSVGSYIDATTWGGGLSEGFDLKVEQAGAPDDPGYNLQFPGRKLRLFPKVWHDQRIVEMDALPSDGGCFVLVCPEASGEFEEWANLFEAKGGSVADFTRSGLPRGACLLYLENLQAANDELRRTFPCEGISRSLRRERISLQGGSRIQTTAAQRVYLPYDPPIVRFVGPALASLKVEGATHTPLVSTTPRSPHGMPGEQLREFELKVEDEAASVRITSVLEEPNWVPDVVSFGISREANLLEPYQAGSEPRFQNLGRKSTGGGIIGASLDPELSQGGDASDPWNYEEIELGVCHIATESDANEPAWQLLESLSQSRAGRITASEFSRRAAKILNWWDSTGWWEARWLRALCYVEIERDNRGRLSYVYPVPPQAYLLPSKSDGNWLTVICGSPTRAMLHELVNLAPELDTNILVSPSDRNLVPSRWICSSSELENIQLLLDECGFTFSAPLAPPHAFLPSCVSIADWAASLDQWQDELYWIDGPGPRSERDFNPYLLRMTQEEKFHCPYRLISMVDSITAKHRWHTLFHNGGIFENPRHAFLRDPAWGKWRSMAVVSEAIPQHSKNDDDDVTPIPFEKDSNTLVVPASLVFPAMLSRALLTATGLPPRSVTNVHYFNHSESPFLPEKAPPYTGTCYRYERVPLKLAKIVANKVKAEPILVHQGKLFPPS